MPYVDTGTRQRLAEAGASARVSGELNYEITKLITRFVLDRGLSYQTCNDVVGALDNAKDEFRRRVQHPYEDTKIAINGDVYTELLEAFAVFATERRDSEHLAGASAAPSSPTPPVLFA